MTSVRRAEYIGAHLLFLDPEPIGAFALVHLFLLHRELLPLKHYSLMHPDVLRTGCGMGLVCSQATNIARTHFINDADVKELRIACLQMARRFRTAGLETC